MLLFKKGNTKEENQKRRIACVMGWECKDTVDKSFIPLF